jgi:transposase, IS6 family
MSPTGASSAFAEFPFPREVIWVAVRRYLRYGLSYRDVEELLAERGVNVAHVTIYRWVQRFTPEFVEAARARRHVPGDRWLVDETYVQVAGCWTHLYRAIDQYGQVIDVWLPRKQDPAAARVFFSRALTCGTVPVEVTTDRAPVFPRVLGEFVPAALHVTQQYANNAVESDHGRLKARLRPMRSLQRFRSARILAAVMTSSKTSDAATTSWPSTSRHNAASGRPSTSWPLHLTDGRRHQTSPPVTVTPTAPSDRPRG